MNSNTAYMAFMGLVAMERGYDPFKVALEADHNAWLAFCYEIHDMAIIRWRKKGNEYVPFWTTYRFRQFLLSLLNKSNT